jgi:hypothetical protein
MNVVNTVINVIKVSIDGFRFLIYSYSSHSLTALVKDSRPVSRRATLGSRWFSFSDILSLSYNNGYPLNAPG